MSDKVKLPRNVAEELAAITQHESYPIRFVIDVFESDIAAPSALKTYFETDRSRRIEIVMKALINGYEIEETPEDKVREWYQGLQSQLDSGVNGPYREQVVRELTTIDKCIRLLNIKIEGVNA